MENDIYKLLVKASELLNKEFYEERDLKRVEMILKTVEEINKLDYKPPIVSVSLINDLADKVAQKEKVGV